MWTSQFCYSVWCQQVSPQLLSDHPGCAGCWCSIAPWSPASNVSLTPLGGGKTQGEWEAAGHVRWTRNICLGFVQESCRAFWKDFIFLTRTDMVWHRVLENDRRRNRDAASLTDSRSWKGWQSGHLWSLPHGFSGLWVPGLCKVHGVCGNLETLHNSEIVYMTIKTVSNQII